ncbi:MAG: hypothetical protein E7620_03235 [Ruminococcaceae bacterium]|nr:hypothetical protein [Oscillospiraceae bacterium]
MTLARKMKLAAVLSVALTVVSAICLRIWNSGLWISVTVTCATFAYHFCMRLAVGYAVQGVMRNQAELSSPWYRPRAFEKRLYAFLRVRKWRDRLPTYAPEQFSRERHTLEEIAMAMCQAEIVHEVIALLSFLPLIVVPWLGSFWVFFGTSLLAAGYDLLFVILQRYNRPILLRVIEKQQKRNHNTKWN